MTLMATFVVRVDYDDDDGATLRTFDGIKEDNSM